MLCLCLQVTPSSDFMLFHFWGASHLIMQLVGVPEYLFSIKVVHFGQVSSKAMGYGICGKALMPCIHDAWTLSIILLSFYGLGDE